MQKLLLVGVHYEQQALQNALKIKWKFWYTFLTTSHSDGKNSIYLANDSQFPFQYFL